MKLITVFILGAGLSILSTLAQENCLKPNQLKKLDASWEKALLELNLEFLEKTVSEDFIWVHTHATKIDNKKSLIEETRKALNSPVNTTKSRISKDVRVIISGKTGIVTGFTKVDRGPNPITYHFMRTYVESDEKCYLLANQTMAIPEDEKN